MSIPNHRPTHPALPCPCLCLLIAAAPPPQEMEGAAARASLPVDPQGAIDYSGDFFGEKVFLTVSGQLNGMMGPCFLGLGLGL